VSYESGTEKSNEIPPGIIVLGSHRSGTSALAGVLSILGLNFGGDLIPADPGVNEKGYYENRDIVEFNNRLLESLGSGWYDVFEFPPDWADLLTKTEFPGKLSEIFLKGFSTQNNWAIKDPRLCRLLPFWKHQLEVLGSDTYCAFVLRNPIEVAM
jgi:hypothetical protein